MIYSIWISTSLVIFITIALVNYLFNKYWWGKTKNEMHELPRISVLIPMRNEESNVMQCLEAIARQSYSNLEVWVYEDQSTDKTASLLDHYATRNQYKLPMKVISGKKYPKPEHWLGKNWACWQLAQQANAKYILFLDADVRLKSDAILETICIIQASQAQLLSVFPTQIYTGFGQRLITPIVYELVSMLLPLPLVYKAKTDIFSAANGQFMLFEKEAYFQISGHKGTKRRVVEDMELARGAKKVKYKVLTLFGNSQIQSHMYSSFIESFRGFSKNLQLIFTKNSILFVLLILFLAGIFLSALTFPIGLILLIILRFVNSLNTKQYPLINIIMHPIQILSFAFTALYSAYLNLFQGHYVWKGRKIKLN